MPKFKVTYQVWENDYPTTKEVEATQINMENREYVIFERRVDNIYQCEFMVRRDLFVSSERLIDDPT